LDELQDKNENLIGVLISKVPIDAEISRIQYEGPRIALYSKNLKFMRENSHIINDIVNTVKRRVVIRSDKSIRKKEGESKTILSSKLPKEVEITNMFFDDALGEVIVETPEPNKLINNEENTIEQISDEIGWIIKIKKASPIPSLSIQNIYRVLKDSVDSREKFYLEVGEKIFRKRLSSSPQISITALGGFNQVGRSCVLLTTQESRIILDCGILPNAKNPWDAYPRFDWADVDMSRIDAVIIGHAHLDHSGYLPVLFKYGYQGPVYCTEPTLVLMTLLHNDYVKIAGMEGKNVLYEGKDVRKMIEHVIPVLYNQVTDISPDVKMMLSNAGHILGSATVHLHVGEGAHNILYTGDFKFGKTALLDSTVWNYPRVETLIMESTYGGKADIMPSREEIENNLTSSINETLSNGGKVLIPVPAVGRAQEIMLVLNDNMKKGNLKECPIFLEGMISEATAIHTAFPEFLERSLKNTIMNEKENPFLSEYFTFVKHRDKREEALQQGPVIIMATSGMLEGGPVLRYFEELAPHDKNKLLFVSYQIAGTMGRRILDGSKQVSITNDKGKMKIIDINAAVEKADGFSGHSDYNQLIKFVGKLRPKLHRVIINHGERSKVKNLSRSVNKIYRLDTYKPEVQEALKIY